jgi:hypothetical protein
MERAMSDSVHLTATKTRDSRTTEMPDLTRLRGGLLVSFDLFVERFDDLVEPFHFFTSAG